MNPDALPLQDLLAGLHQELLTLQDLSAEAQVLMGVALQHATLDGGQWARAQSLDLITQRLQCLAGVVDSLGAMVPGGLLMDGARAVRTVTLSDVAQRLLRAPCEVGQAASIELF